MAKLTYRKAGVDTTRKEAGLERLLHWVEKTLTFGERPAALGIGYFANVLDLGNGLGLAISTDGVGTKLLVAQMLGKYDTVGIDCVAMNVNDILCVGARPLALVDYIAVEKADPGVLEEIGKGLYQGAEMARVSIVGGEIAQIKEMLRGVKKDRGFDLVGTCIGEVPVEKIILGQDIHGGDLLLGLPSSGIHSNGLTLARKVLFQKAKFKPDQYVAELGRSVGEELLEPTRIYVKVVLDLLRAGVRVKALLHITGGGLFNLTRVKADVGYIIEDLPEPPPIFRLIQKLGVLDDEEMYQTFNMGIGFCLVLPEVEYDRARDISRSHNLEAFRLGFAVRDRERRIVVKPRGLIGQEGRFRKG